MESAFSPRLHEFSAGSLLSFTAERSVGLTGVSTLSRPEYEAEFALRWNAVLSRAAVHPVPRAARIGSGHHDRELE